MEVLKLAHAVEQASSSSKRVDTTGYQLSRTIIFSIELSSLSKRLFLFFVTPVLVARGRICS
jgi:hypothetical protein